MQVTKGNGFKNFIGKIFGINKTDNGSSAKSNTKVTDSVCFVAKESPVSKQEQKRDKQYKRYTAGVEKRIAKFENDMGNELQSCVFKFAKDVVQLQKKTGLTANNIIAACRYIIANPNKEFTLYTMEALRISYGATDEVNKPAVEFFERSRQDPVVASTFMTLLKPSEVFNSTLEKRQAKIQAMADHATSATPNQRDSNSRGSPSSSVSRQSVSMHGASISTNSDNQSYSLSSVDSLQNNERKLTISGNDNGALPESIGSVGSSIGNKQSLQSPSIRNSSANSLSAADDEVGNRDQNGAHFTATSTANVESGVISRKLVHDGEGPDDLDNEPDETPPMMQDSRLIDNIHNGNIQFCEENLREVNIPERVPTEITRLASAMGGGIANALLTNLGVNEEVINVLSTGGNLEHLNRVCLAYIERETSEADFRTALLAMIPGQVTAFTTQHIS